MSSPVVALWGANRSAPMPATVTMASTTSGMIGALRSNLRARPLLDTTPTAAKASAGRPTLASRADTWIEHPIEKIDSERYRHIDEREEEHDALEELVVA